MRPSMKKVFFDAFTRAADFRRSVFPFLLFALLIGSANAASMRERAIASFIVRGKASRFNQPWPRLSKDPFPSLSQSRHRLFYSPMWRYGNDGIGHGFASKNAEVVLARMLGVSYVHRRPHFGHLTNTNETENFMEDFFGWGKSEIPRKEFFKEFCEKDEPENIRTCAPCGKLKKNYKLVQIPRDISVAFNTAENRAKIAQFAAQHNDSHTIFEMHGSLCQKKVSVSDFAHSEKWFRFKYWDRHFVSARSIAKQALNLYGLDRPSRKKSLRAGSAALQNIPLRFKDSELTIAVHVRRGDFFVAKNRRMLNSSLYAQIISTVQDVVEEAGGKFAKLPVAVYIYSEGRPKARKKNGELNFEQRHPNDLTSEYIDENQIVRDAKWWQQLISSKTPQQKDRPKSRWSANCTVPRVEMRISQPTIQTIHQMIRADVFIGSVSGLSTHVVRNLARGIGVHPNEHQISRSCCYVNSDVSKGIMNRKLFAAFWSKYRKANERHLD